MEPDAATRLRHTDAHDGPSLPDSLFDFRTDDFRNRLLWGDNRRLMEGLLPEFRGKIDLVYLDPPFDAGQEFNMAVAVGEDAAMGREKGLVLEATAYRDVWDRARGGYLQMLYERLPLIRELLSETGSLFVHVNWRVAHLVQALLDEIFGPGERAGAGLPGFRTEIVWGFGGGGAPRNVYPRKHDNLFWYTKSGQWTFNPQYRPYTEKTWQRGLTAVKGDRYELREEGALLQTWWTGPEVQKILSPTAAENRKYPTQKPETLLERIIRGHSNTGDLIADFFCGSGTTGAVAERLGRRWIMADAARLAVHVTRKRMLEVQSQLAAHQAYRAFDEHRVAGECLTLAELRERAREAAEAGLQELEVLAPELAPDLIRELNATDEEIPVHLRLFLAPDDALLTGSGPLRPRGGHTPIEPGMLVAEPVLHPDGTVDVRLVKFRPSLPAEASPEVRERATLAGFDFLDYWAVDFDYPEPRPFEEAPPIRHQWQSYRTLKDRRVRLASNAAHTYGASGPHRIAIKAIDLFGLETVSVLRNT